MASPNDDLPTTWLFGQRKPLVAGCYDSNPPSKIPTPLGTQQRHREPVLAVAAAAAAGANTHAMLYPNNKIEVITGAYYAASGHQGGSQRHLSPRTDVVDLVEAEGGLVALAVDATSVWAWTAEGTVLRAEAEERPVRPVSVDGEPLPLAFEANPLALEPGVRWTSLAPLSLASRIAVTQVACGHTHAVAVDRPGAVYACGGNRHGQLGLGHTNDVNSTAWARLEPASFGQDAVQSVAAGGAHSFAVGVDGAVFAWGWNKYGQLGVEKSDEAGAGRTHEELDDDHRSQPVRLAVCPWATAERRAMPLVVVCGVAHSLLLAESVAVEGGGEDESTPTRATFVFAWGLDADGQLGLGAQNAAEQYLTSSKAAARVVPTPQHVAALDSRFVEQLAAGSFHSLAITAGGQLFTWGRGDDGQLGHGLGSESSPRLLLGPLRSLRLEQAAATSSYTVVLSASAPDRIERVAIDNVGLDFARLLPGAQGVVPRDPELDGLADLVLAVGFGDGEEEEGEEGKATDAVTEAPPGDQAAAHEAKDTDPAPAEHPCARLVVHSCLVHARCPHLAAVPPSGSDDDGREVVDLPRLRPQEVRAALEWMYTGGVGYTDPQETEPWDHARLLQLAVDWKLAPLIDWLAEKPPSQEPGAECPTLDPTVPGAPDSGLGMDLARLGGAWCTGDVVLLATDETDDKVNAHKVLLAARCDFFRAALLGHFAESSSRTVVMHGGFSGEALQVLRDFLYCGSLDTASSPVQNRVVSCELMALADVCGLEQLQQQCEACADELINDEFSVPLLVGADMFGAEKLRARCLQYVVDRLEVLEEQGQLDPSNDSLPPAILDEIHAKAARFETSGTDDGMLCSVS